MTIRLGTEDDIDDLAWLYDDLNDYLAVTTNYPGWKKGVYPVRENAIDGIKEGCLYVATDNDEIIGSMILRHMPEPAYLTASWQVELNYENCVGALYICCKPKSLEAGNWTGDARIRCRTWTQFENQGFTLRRL